MSAKQEVINKLPLLSESNADIVLALVNAILGKEKSNLTFVNTDNTFAYEKIIKMAKENPVPENFDFDEARKEAMADKYGSFN